MRKASAVLLALALATTACGDDDRGITDPAEATTCEELAEVTLHLLQEAIDAVEGMALTDFLETADAGDLPTEFQRIETVGAEVEARAEVLGCSAEEGRRLVCRRIEELRAESQVAQLILTSIAGEC